MERLIDLKIVSQFSTKICNSQNPNGLITDLKRAAIGFRSTTYSARAGFEITTLAESLELSCGILERSIKSADNLLSGGKNDVCQRTRSATDTGGTIIAG